MGERATRVFIRTYFSFLIVFVIGIIIGDFLWITLGEWGAVVCGPVIYVVYKLIDLLENLRSKWKIKKD